MNFILETKKVKSQYGHLKLANRFMPGKHIVAL